MVRAVNIRALKDKLSAYLRDVARGDVILVTDRGRVVAELRAPSAAAATSPVEARRQRLVDAGALAPGLENTREAYRRPRVRIPVEAIDAALAFTRGEP